MDNETLRRSLLENETRGSATGWAGNRDLEIVRRGDEHSGPRLRPGVSSRSTSQMTRAPYADGRFDEMRDCETKLREIKARASFDSGDVDYPFTGYDRVGRAESELLRGPSTCVARYLTDAKLDRVELIELVEFVLKLRLEPSAEHVASSGLDDVETRSKVFSAFMSVLPVQAARRIFKTLPDTMLISDAEFDADGECTVWVTAPEAPSDRLVWFSCKNSGKTLLALDEHRHGGRLSVTTVSDLSKAFDEALAFLTLAET